MKRDPARCYRIEIPGVPVPLLRARTTWKNGQVYAYTPKESAQAKRDIGWIARQAMRGEKPLTSPVSIRAVFRMPIPASWSAARKVEAEGQPHCTRPDTSNLLKLVEDACIGIVYQDDGQIWDYERVSKVYSRTPGTVFEVISTVLKAQR